MLPEIDKEAIFKVIIITVVVLFYKKLKNSNFYSKQALFFLRLPGPQH
jgi:hypothetical protein